MPSQPNVQHSFRQLRKYTAAHFIPFPLCIPFNFIPFIGNLRWFCYTSKVFFFSSEQYFIDTLWTALAVFASLHRADVPAIGENKESGWPKLL